ncbi:MAG: competence protein ComK [Anaerorhabdus sp.]
MYTECDLIYYENKQTIVKKDNKVIGNIKFKPKDIINNWCLENGSSMSGRMKSARHILNIKQKPPIIISEKRRIILIPTTSCFSIDCIYIQYKNIEKVKFVSQGVSKILTKSNKELIIDVDRRVIVKQIKRVEKLLKHLKIENRVYYVQETY